jgi:glycosyltransferase involved in cell wall biosynthesis
MHVAVSVIIPTCNRLELLKRAVDSVLAQTFHDFEIIIINDASKDGTADYLRELTQNNPCIHAINNSRSLGGSKSRNLGIAASKGKWVAFLDDDDSWLPDKLAVQLQALNANPEAVACSASYRVNYPWGIKKIIHTPMAILPNELLKANVLGGASVCICAGDVLKQLGGFDAKLRSAQDWDLWIKLRAAGLIISTERVLVQYYVHFNYRISNDMRAKYLGARRFYFKYKSMMSMDARNNNVAFLCFIKSRQSGRSMWARMRYLSLAWKNSAPGVARGYLMSSLPRILLSPLSLV